MTMADGPADDLAEAGLRESLNAIACETAGFAAEFDTLGAPDDALSIAEGYRIYTRYLAIGLEQYVEYADPAFPAFFQKTRAGVRKFAGDSPAQLYDSCPVSGAHEYRVTGSMTDTELIEFTVYAGDFRAGTPRRLVDSLTERELAIADDGSLAVHLGADAPVRGGLRLDADSASLVVRRYVADPRTAAPRPLAIERTSPGPAAPRATPASVAEGIAAAAGFARRHVHLWAGWARQAQNTKLNALTPMADAGDLHTPAGHRYYDGYWSLPEGGRLTVEFTPPAGAYWSFVPMNYWLESFEWRFGPRTYATSLDCAPDEATGVVRLVLADADPQLPGHVWISTDGHREGVMSLRFGRCEGDISGVRVALHA